tara:strand:- start:635 stop:1231 length:597 start_codon:yes stop_codon:yes gene_type:complete
MTLLVAITGGIGSGKSTFSNEVKKRGFKLLDSDQEVSKLYKKPNKNFLDLLKSIKLGNSIEGKKINKKIISEKIFDDSKTREKLEKYIHKAVRESREKFLKKEKKNKTKVVFMDIPLLFENKLNKNFDLIISIISSKKIRIKRLRKSKNMKTKTFNKITKIQTSDMERKKNSDIIIFNNYSMSNFLNKINQVLDLITT